MELLGNGKEPMPRAYWSPLYLAAEESLVSRSGLLNFFHDYLRKAVEDRYFHDTIKKCLDTEKKRLAHLRLADYFDKKELDARKVDELPWLLRQAEARDRLRACLLDIDQFLLIQKRDQNELMVYWVWLREEREMGEGYLESFESWSGKPGNQDLRTSYAANGLVVFLLHAALHAEAEPFMRRALRIDEQSFGENHPNGARDLNDLAALLQATNRLAEAEPLCRRMVEIFLQFTSKTGHTHPHLHAATNNYAGLLHAMGHSAEDIRDDLKKLGKRFVVDLGGTGGHANAQPSPKLRAVIEQLNRDPSKAQEIFGKLQREDPALLQELIPLIQRQQQK